MGMYDTVTVVGGLKCGAGHPVEDFQTKDLDCTMNHHIVFGKMLFRLGIEFRSSLKESFKLKGKTLEITRGPDRAELFAYTGTISIYTGCRECKPVITLNDSGIDWDKLKEHEPWVHYELRFKEGKLVETHKGAEFSTRASLRKDLAMEGSKVLSDTSPIVKRHNTIRGRK